MQMTWVFTHTRVLVRGHLHADGMGVYPHVCAGQAQNTCMTEGHPSGWATSQPPIFFSFIENNFFLT